MATRIAKESIQPDESIQGNCSAAETITDRCNMARYNRVILGDVFIAIRSMLTEIPIFIGDL